MEFVGPMIHKIREQVSEDFMIGIRLGAYEPTLEDGIAHAKKLESAGIDFIDVSYGFRRKQIRTVLIAGTDMRISSGQQEKSKSR